MKIKLKNDRILPNNWKVCGYSAEEWEALNNGETIEINSVPELIENDVDVVQSASKPKQPKEGRTK